jgi:hypothetical protein
VCFVRLVSKTWCQSSDTIRPCNGWPISGLVTTPCCRRYLWSIAFWFARRGFLEVSVAALIRSALDGPALEDEAPVKSIQMPLGSTGSGSWSFVNTLKLALCLMPTSSVDPNSCISRWARLNNGYAGLGEPLQQSAAHTLQASLTSLPSPFCSLHFLYESLNLSSCSGVISLGDLDRSRLERSPIHYRDSKE